MNSFATAWSMPETPPMAYDSSGCFGAQHLRAHPCSYQADRGQDTSQGPMPLKYEYELKQRPDQPCPRMKDFAPRDRKAFRYMHRPATEEGDFEPPAIVDGGVKTRDKCGRMALSFFESVNAARERWKSLEEREDAEERYGGHIGEIDLVKSDGLMSEPSPTGHINLHQDRDARFAGRVVRYFRAGTQPPPAPPSGVDHAT